jgi:hypothetical protein
MSKLVDEIKENALIISIPVLMISGFGILHNLPNPRASDHQLSKPEQPCTPNKIQSLNSLGIK